MRLFLAALLAMTLIIKLCSASAAEPDLSKPKSVLTVAFDFSAKHVVAVVVPERRDAIDGHLVDVVLVPFASSEIDWPKARKIGALRDVNEGNPSLRLCISKDVVYCVYVDFQSWEGSEILFARLPVSEKTEEKGILGPVKIPKDGAESKKAKLFGNPLALFVDSKERLILVVEDPKRGTIVSISSDHGKSWEIGSLQ